MSKEFMIELDKLIGKYLKKGLSKSDIIDRLRAYIRLSNFIEGGQTDER